MLIEYKIKFEKDGVTITQRVEPNGSNRREQPRVSGKPTFSKLLGDTVGDGFAEDPEIVGGGGPSPGSGRVIAFGPLIFCDSDGTVAIPSEKDPEKDIDAEKENQAPPPAAAAAKSK